MLLLIPSPAPPLYKESVIPSVTKKLDGLAQPFPFPPVYCAKEAVVILQRKTSIKSCRTICKPCNCILYVDAQNYTGPFAFPPRKRVVFSAMRCGWLSSAQSVNSQLHGFFCIHPAITHYLAVHAGAAAGCGAIDIPFRIGYSCIDINSHSRHPYDFIYFC